MAHGTHRGVCSRSSKPPYAKPESQREQTNALRLLASSVLDQRQKPPMNQNAGREEMRTYVLPTATGASCKAGGKQQSAPAPRAQMHLHTQRTDALVQGSRLASRQKKATRSASEAPEGVFSRETAQEQRRAGKAPQKRLQREIPVYSPILCE